MLSKSNLEIKTNVISLTSYCRWTMNPFLLIVCVMALAFCPLTLAFTSSDDLVFESGFEEMTKQKAVDFLTRASFGATQSSVDELMAIGASAWIGQQINASYNPSRIEQSVENYDPDNYGLNAAWWDNAIKGENQLRNRVAYALSQIIVVSAAGYELNNRSIEVASYYDMLRRHAFGNYKELLLEVSQHPAMGRYLSGMYNSRSIGNIRPDENYARELLQLFTLGTAFITQRWFRGFG